MCNDCNCDSSDLCSIVGTQPIGFCCGTCELFDEIRTCLKARMSLTDDDKHLLSRSFCVKMHKKIETPELQH